jgi:hypothetical protein
VGYYMRFIGVDERTVSVADLQSAIDSLGAGSRVEGDGRHAVVTTHGAPIGDVTINLPGDGLFEDEVAELIEFAEDASGRGKKAVLKALRGARTIVAVQVLDGAGPISDSLDALDPIWTWLVENRDGLVQADGEGYYKGRRLLLRVQ